MNSPLRTPFASIVPENAPFTADQRVWLNGFFAGLLDGDVSALSPQDASALMPGVNVGGEADDGAPWHDQTLPLADRMKLADGKPLRRKMMAAMGQQDCGQCGYNCEQYADALFDKKEERLNLCVPGGKETARMLKALHVGNRIGSGGCAGERTGQNCHHSARRGRPLPRQPGRGDVRVAHLAQQAGLREADLAHRVRSHRVRARLQRRRCVRSLSDQRSGSRRCDPEGARRAAGFPDRRPHAARRADRRRVAGARARHAVPALLLHHRRRAPEESQGARQRRGSGRRRRDARRARRDREVPRRAARSGSPHRGARSAAAAALFDLVVAEGQHRPYLADRRHRALRDQQAHAARRRLHLPRRPRQAGRQDQGLCPEGARLRPTGRSVGADHHGRPRHRRGAVPRLPARAHGDQGARPQLAVLRPSASRLRFLL